jgi:peptidyl-tRNA hydrolase
MLTTHKHGHNKIIQVILEILIIILIIKIDLMNSSGKIAMAITTFYLDIRAIILK